MHLIFSPRLRTEHKLNANLVFGSFIGEDIEKTRENKILRIESLSMARF